jgi:hypothetical protein
MMDYPVTPDGRYFVVRGRLWRCSNPFLSKEQRDEFVRQLMVARRAVRSAMQAQDAQRLKEARDAVDRAKNALGERGGVWWSDGAPDYNRKSVRKTPCASWYEGLSKVN